MPSSHRQEMTHVMDGISTKGAMTLERRKAMRQTAIQSGRVYLNNRTSYVCTILNFSEGGAKIRVNNPADFTRIVKLQARNDETKPCQAVWRSGNNIGLQFTKIDRINKGESEELSSSRGVRILEEGQIVFNRAQCVLQCQILSMSDSGARIRPNDLALCPKRFQLRMKDGPTRNCQVIRTENGEVAVRFIEI